MDWLQFISSLVSSLAWPAAVVILAIALRRQLGTLLPRLQSVKYKDIQVEFEKTLEKAEAEASTALPPKTAPALPAELTDEERFARIVEVNPSAAVLAAWSDVEVALKSIAEQAGIQPPGRRFFYPLSIVKRLDQMGRIDHQTSALIDDLRALRNLAAHPEAGRAVSAEDAWRVKQLAAQAVTMLRAAGSTE
jgi:hypothetical protein